MIQCIIDKTIRLEKVTNNTFLAAPLVSGNSLAHMVRLRVLDSDGEPADLTGISATGAFNRPDGHQVTPINVTITGNVVECVFPASCYTTAGRFRFMLDLNETVNNETALRTAFVLDGLIEIGPTGSVIDPGTPVPNIQAAIANAQLATTAANTAAQTATTAAAAAQDVADNVEGEVSELKSALKQTAEVANQIVYYSQKASGTYRTISYDVDEYDVTINGTSDSTIKLKLTNGVSGAISSSYPGAWEKTIPLKSGRKYKLGINVISGTASETPPNVVVLDNDNVQLASIPVADGNAQVFSGIGKNVLVYVYVTNGRGGTNLKFRVTLLDVTDAYNQNAQIEENAADIERLSGIVNNMPVTGEETLTSGGFYASGSNAVGDTATLGSSSNGKYGIFDISYAEGGTIEIETSSVTESSTTVSLFCDSDHKILSKFVTSDSLVISDGVYKGRLAVPINTKYLQYSVYKGAGTITLSQKHKSVTDANNTMYVTVDGSDDNDGLSISTAKATVSAAIGDGAKTILVGGGTYEQQIDLSRAKGDIKIVPAVKDGLPVFVAPDSLIATEETAVSGTTKVYSSECAKTFDSKIVWIFQDGVPDASTEIDADDRHPLQRGRQYRCGDTRIVKCSANNTADAITEIENASGYKWYLDSDNDTIYFSRPQSVSVSNPIRTSFGGALFSNISRADFLHITGICVKYMYMNIGGCVNAVISDCECHNAMAEAGFRWSRGVGVKFYRCEASQIFYSTTSGDGFNAHSDTTGDAFAHQTTCMLFDCWGHDCCDDGYSDHERCEISIYGGLFENNGGGGVTPAQGSHCTCYNVLSRYNSEADFFYTGNPSVDEGGVGGQIACYGCVSQGNGSGKGYRLNGSAIEGLFVNCVCIDRDTAFYAESTGSGSQVGTLVNCTTVNCTTQKSSNYTVKNGTPVT